MSPRPALLVLSLVLAAFTIFTGVVVAEHGYTGFLTLAAEDPWGGQVFVDLVIALVLFAIWMRDDATREGMPYWPYLVLILGTGSIGALGYLVHRTARRLREEARTTEALRMGRTLGGA